MTFSYASQSHLNVGSWQVGSITHGILIISHYLRFCGAQNTNLVASVGPRITTSSSKRATRVWFCSCQQPAGRVSVCVWHTRGHSGKHSVSTWISLRFLQCYRDSARQSLLYSALHSLRHDAQLRHSAPTEPQPETQTERPPQSASFSLTSRVWAAAHNELCWPVADSAASSAAWC